MQLWWMIFNSSKFYDLKGSSVKNIPNSLRGSVSAEVRTLAACLKIEVNGKKYGYTSHQEDLSIDSLIYKATPGFTCETLNSNLLSGENSFTIDFLMTEDVKVFLTWLQGLNDRTMLTLLYVDYQDLEKGAFSMRHGHMGQISFSKGQASVEIRSLMERLGQEIGELYSPDCRAHLGDHRCKANIEPFKLSGIVKELTPLKINIDGKSDSVPYKSLTWISGENKGLKSEVKNFEKDSGVLTLFLPPFGRIALGDKLIMVPGCDKTLRCCHENYKNTLNFRGEPFIPEA